VSRGQYYKDYITGKINDFKAIDNLLAILGKQLKIEPVPEGLIKGLPKPLRTLPLYIAKGHYSWAGLVVGFVGTKKQLSIEYVSSPYLRKLLYPIMELYDRIEAQGTKLNCVYFLGAKFSEVFIRKFNQLKLHIPHVIVLTQDLLKAKNQPEVPKFPNNFNEAWVQAYLCRELSKPEGIEIPVAGGSINAGLVGYEVPTHDGTVDSERADILAQDKANHGLIVMELKGLQCSKSELFNLFYQADQHRVWLENNDNKMAIKALFDGIRGKRISTKKRVRLVLCYFGDIPDRFYSMAQKLMEKDKYLKIDFVKLVQDGDQIRLVRG